MDGGIRPGRLSQLLLSITGWPSDGRQLIISPHRGPRHL